MIVLYTVILLRVEWKPLGLISGLIVQLHLLSCGKAAFQKTIVHTTGRTLKLPLDLHLRSSGNALNNMGGFSLFKRDLALSNIWLFFLYVTGCLWGRICCSSLHKAGLLSAVFSLAYLSVWSQVPPEVLLFFLLLIDVRPSCSLLEYFKIFLHSLTLRIKAIMVCDLYGRRLCLAIFKFVLRSFQPYSYSCWGDSSGRCLKHLREIPLLGPR